METFYTFSETVSDSSGGGARARGRNRGESRRQSYQRLFPIPPAVVCTGQEPWGADAKVTEITRVIST